jgi:hypothetical protein
MPDLPARWLHAGIRSRLVNPPFVSSCDLLALVPGRVTLLSDAGSWQNASLPKLIAALWRRGPG